MNKFEELKFKSNEDTALIPWGRYTVLSTE